MKYLLVALTIIILTTTILIGVSYLFIELYVPQEYANFVFYFFIPIIILFSAVLMGLFFVTIMRNEEDIIE